MEISDPKNTKSLNHQPNVKTTILAQPNLWQTETAAASNSQSLRQQFESTPLEGVQTDKPSIWRRVLNASKAFANQITDLVCGERVNILLVVVPVGIAVGLLVRADPIVVFILNALAIIPLAVIISTATESLASRLGDTPGALLNVTVGNAAELIIFFTALAKDQIRIVQASLLGSILANSLLVLGTANICGGLRFGSQLYDKATGRLSVCLLDVGLAIALLPVGIFAVSHDIRSNKVKATVLSLSRGISIGLVIVYLLYLLLQMMIQTGGSHPTRSVAGMPGPTYRSLQQQQPYSPFERSGLPFPRKRDGSWQWRSKRFRGLSFASPNFHEHQNRLRTFFQTFGIASSLHKLRTNLFAAPNDPVGNYYRLHDLNDHSSASDLPRLGTVEAHSSEQRKTNMHELPFFPNAQPKKRPDTPLDDPHDFQHAGSNGRSSPLPLSPPSTPDRSSSPSAEFPEAHRKRSGTKSLDHAPLPDPERFEWPDTPTDTHSHREASGRKSPSDSEQSFKAPTSLSVAIVVLLIATAIAAITTELAVDAIPALVDSWNISHVFLGFIVLPFVGNAAEHVTAAKMALRNRMVLAKNVAVESATQVVLFITPAIVLIGWLRGRNMTLQFDHFEIGCILLTGLVVSIAICRGDSGWKQGLVLHAIYLTVALGAVLYRGNS